MVSTNAGPISGRSFESNGAGVRVIACMSEPRSSPSNGGYPTVAV